MKTDLLEMCHVVTSLEERPFTRTVRALTLRYTFEHMSRRCHRARSGAWFNNLMLRQVGVERWGVNPPGPETWPHLAELFKVPVSDVREMIAHEWLGVSTNGVSDRVARLATRVDALAEADLQLLVSLLDRLNGQLDADPRRATPSPTDRG